MAKTLNPPDIHTQTPLAKIRMVEKLLDRQDRVMKNKKTSKSSKMLASNMKSTRRMMLRPRPMINLVVHGQ